MSFEYGDSALCLTPSQRDELARRLRDSGSYVVEVPDSRLSVRVSAWPADSWGEDFSVHFDPYLIVALHRSVPSPSVAPVEDIARTLTLMGVSVSLEEL